MATRGVFGLINDDQGRLLVCERADGKGWNLPGGGVSPGETDKQALVREVKEETGLDVVVLEQVGVPLHFKEDVAVAYRCKVVGGDLITTTEAISHQYVTSAGTKTMTWAGLRTYCLVLTSFYVLPQD